MDFGMTGADFYAVCSDALTLAYKEAAFDIMQ